MQLQHLPVVVLWWLMTMVAYAAPVAVPNSDGDGDSYSHRRWSQADGAPQQITAMAQTDDGMIWLSSLDGLTSFDGLRFRKTKSIWGHPLPSLTMVSMTKIPGGLAVGYGFGGLSIVTPTSATHYVAGKDFPEGTTLSMAMNRRGELYAATTRSLARLVDGRWQQVAQGALAGLHIYYLGFDDDDTLWVRAGAEMYALAAGDDKFRHIATSNGFGVSSIQGRLHVVAPGRGYVRLTATGPVPVKTDHPARYKDLLMEGPHGSLWTAAPEGIVRLAPGRDGTLRPVETFGPGRGKNGTCCSMLDREGNLWVATADGVERFRRHRLHQIAYDAATLAGDWQIQRGIGDELWMGANGQNMVRLGAGGRRTATTVNSPNAILRATAEHVWVGTQTELWEFQGRQVRKWPLPPGLGNTFSIQALGQGADGGILVSIQRNGLWHFRAGHWTRDQRLDGLADPTPIAILNDSTGKTWLGFTNSRLGELLPAGLRMLPPSAGLGVGNVLSLFEYQGRLLAGGEGGLAWIDGARAHALQPARVGQFRGISGMIAAADGDLWLHGAAGLTRVPALQFARLWQAPQLLLDSEVFDFHDGLRGLPPMTRPLPSLALGPEGRIYYATMEGAGWVDPAAIERNAAPPQLIVETLRTATGQYRAVNGMRLPERTTMVDIGFTATALSIPERVRLRYKLENVDQDWREVEEERSAHYTNLAPGNYRFSVIGANEDGVWNRQGTHLDFRIEPAFWQTGWFYALCGGALAALLALLYRWRVAIVSGRVARRTALQLEARLGERERIARSLHDNLLQGVQALVLQCQLALMRMPRDSDAQRLLDRAVTYAEGLFEHARDEVSGLRERTASVEQAAPVDLVAQARSILDALAIKPDELLQFATEGQARPVSGDVATEVLYVMREAVLNSVRHAHARRIVVLLRFDAAGFAVQVQDDGVGIAPALARDGRAGHWGVLGMRERGHRIGGTIDIAAGPDGGTIVCLRVPTGSMRSA